MHRRGQSRYLWHSISRIPTGNENCKSIHPRATDTVECEFCHNRTTVIGQQFDGFDDCRTCLEAMVPPYNVSKIYRSQFLWHAKNPCTRLRTISMQLHSHALHTRRVRCWCVNTYGLREPLYFSKPKKEFDTNYSYYKCSVSPYHKSIHPVIIFAVAFDILTLI